MSVNIYCRLIPMNTFNIFQLTALCTLHNKIIFITYNRLELQIILTWWIRRLNIQLNIYPSHPIISLISPYSQMTFWLTRGWSLDRRLEVYNCLGIIRRSNISHISVLNIIFWFWGGSEVEKVLSSFYQNYDVVLLPVWDIVKFRIILNHSISPTIVWDFFITVLRERTW